MATAGGYREGLCRSADGTEIFYNVIGQGETVAMCDGIGCDQYAWTYLAPYLAARYRVVRWNYRGHGRSGPPPALAAMTLDHLCQDLEAVLDAVGAVRAVLCGHSMGVQVILEEWLRQRERVLGLVALCGSYGRPLDTFRGSDVAIKALPLLRGVFGRFPNVTQLLWELAVPTRLALAFAGKVEINMDLIRIGDFVPYLDHLGHIDVQLFLALLDDISRRTAEPWLPEIDRPTLVLTGERDTFTPVALAERMHRLVPGSEYLVVPLASHTMPIEMPDLVNLRTEKFLKERVFSERRAADLQP
ncbi:MAG: alpha/beta hydrolase [Deltaproteobacteria bacterium]|nr:alpha/beta hydrolase [Deltaproteobacteria bacterium]